MKWVSIIGDSISTYEGYNPKGYAVFYNKGMQSKNGLNSVYDTWWAKVNQSLKAYLCLNNSFSGSRVTGIGFPAASSSERLNNLSTHTYSPDIILIYVGFNDFGNGVTVRRSGLKKYIKKNLFVFEEAYDYMLAGIKERYPKAKIVCGTLMRTKLRGNEDFIFPESYAGTKFEDYNNSIRKISRKNKCYLADLASLDLRYETIDGTHPTSAGHKTIADAWIRCLLKTDLYL